MKKQLLFILLIQAVLFSLTNAQIAGKLFTKSEADQLFGNVIESVELDLNTAKNLMNLTSKDLLFKIQNNQLIVLDGNRNVIYPENFRMSVNENDVYKRCSISVYSELLNQKLGLRSNETVKFEQRSEVFSITYGETTLEQLVTCPPICP